MPNARHPSRPRRDSCGLGPVGSYSLPWFALSSHGSFLLLSLSLLVSFSLCLSLLACFESAKYIVFFFLFSSIMLNTASDWSWSFFASFFFVSLCPFPLGKLYALWSASHSYNTVLGTSSLCLYPSYFLSCTVHSLNRYCTWCLYVHTFWICSKSFWTCPQIMMLCLLLVHFSYNLEFFCYILFSFDHT